MQTKEAVAVAKKHSFWIICCAMVIIYLGMWYLTVAGLDTEFKSKSTEIDGLYKDADSVRIIENHPNPHSHEGMEQIISDVTKELEKAWEEQYRVQTGVFVWPEKLGDDFIREVKKYHPIETKVAFNATRDPAKEELSDALRERYANYIRDVFPGLAKIIGAKWQPTSRTGFGGAEPQIGGGPKPGSEQADNKPPIVRWDNANQTTIFQNHFTWPDQRANVPSSMQLLYAQEDLWVLTNLVEIVRKVNGDIEADYQAAIKEINFIALGRSASSASGKLAPSRMTQAPGTSMEGYTGSGGPDTGSGAPGAEANAADPAEKRYVDNAYQPLEAEKLRAAQESEDPNTAFLVVAKRMPVRMRFVMDWRKINVLLAECGNARLPVEVRQVRINRTSDASGSGYGAASSVFSLGQSSPTSFSGYGGNETGVTGRSIVSERSPYDLPVEIYGIVYIYNPVRIDKLGINKIESEPAGGPAATESAPEQPASDQPAPAEPAPAKPAAGAAPAAPAT